MRSTSRWAVLAVGLLARAAPAWAEPAPIELQWNAPADCPGATYVLERASRLVGPRARVRSVRSSAVVTPSRQGFELDLTTETDGSRGHRTLQAPSCPSLADATAMILALIVSGETGALPEQGVPGASHPIQSRGALSPALGQAPARRARNHPSTPSTGSRRRSRTPSPARPRSTELGLDAGSAVLLGRFPGATLALAAALIAQVDPFELAMVAGLGPQHESSLTEELSAEFTWLSAGLRACYVPRLQALAVGPCVATEQIWVRATAHGERIDSLAGRGRWTETWLGPRLVWPHPLWALGAAVELGVPWERQEFRLEGESRPVYRVGALLGRLSLGVGLRF
jgi:hypothetical protein